MCLRVVKMPRLEVTSDSITDLKMIELPCPLQQTVSQLNDSQNALSTPST